MPRIERGVEMIGVSVEQDRSPGWRSCAMPNRPRHRRLAFERLKRQRAGRRPSARCPQPMLEKADSVEIGADRPERVKVARCRACAQSTNSMPSLKLASLPRTYVASN
jgi:hypothetical protein